MLGATRLVRAAPLVVSATNAARTRSAGVARMIARSYTMPTKQRSYINLGINIVPHKEAWVIERFGRFHTVLEPGLTLLIPLVDRIAYKHSLKQIAVAVSDQHAITQDNVQLQVSGVLFYTIVDPSLASYGVEDVHYALRQLAESTMRSELGKMTLDRSFEERDRINHAIVASMSVAAAEWGVQVKRYEIRDISPPLNVINAMELQVAAERQKRAKILESEGVKQSSMNVADGVRAKMILESEGARAQVVNAAKGEAEAIVARANASAASIVALATALAANGGKDAAALSLAREYVAAFSQLARKSTTMMLSGDASDASSVVARALGVFSTVASAKELASPLSTGTMTQGQAAESLARLFPATPGDVSGSGRSFDFSGITPTQLDAGSDGAAADAGDVPASSGTHRL